MTNHIASRTLTRLATSIAALAALGAVVACSPATTSAPTPSTSVSASAESSTAATPSEVLAATPWETTSATDQDGNQVALTDENVAMYVGWAYFKADGTFAMYNLDDSPKMRGDWTVTADGSTRTIVSKDEKGEVKFTRDSKIVTLTAEEFTYRVFPDANNAAVYFDIIHTPTNHAEPIR